MLSQSTKKKALSVKKIAENSGVLTKPSVKSTEKGTSGVSAWTGKSVVNGGQRALGS